MMNYTMKTKRPALLPLIALLALAGCGNIFAPAKDDAADTTEGRGIVEIRINSGIPEARTLYPSGLSAIAKYTLSFSDHPSESHEDVELNNGSGSVTLALGQWTITATAYADEAKPSARGSATVAVTEAEPAQATIILKPIIDDGGGLKGSFHYSVTLPVSASAATLTLTNTNAGTPVSGSPIDLKVTSSGALELTSGYYLMRIILANEAGEGAGITEYAHIYPWLTTAAAYNLEDIIWTTITGVTVSSPSTFVKQGGTMVLTATVSGTNDPSQDIVWSVEGAAQGSTTSIDTNGLLTVAVDEPNGASLTVRATSMVDNSKSGTASLTVSDLTGSVSISGTPRVGETLSAYIEGLGGSGEPSYQWIRSEGNIAGATASSYTLSDGDIGYTIKVRVSRAGYTDFVISDPTVAIAPDSLTAFENQLASLGATTAASPATVVLGEGITINTGNDPNNVWVTINNLVANAQKYVILNLSACIAEDNTITGNLSPSGNHFNIIQDNEYIKGIILPSTLTSIGQDAFRDCDHLTGVTIPDSVTSIGEYAFAHCNRLTGITIPDSVTSIGEYAFAYCDGLASITIPDGVESIERGLFYSSGSLASVTIPSGVTSIGFQSFTYTSLTEVIIPGSVVSIAEKAFFVCPNLDTITFGAGSAITTQWDNNTFSTADYALGLDYNSGDSLWNAYNDGPKAGTYTLSGTVWTQPPPGSVSIIGTARVGEVLLVNTGSLGGNGTISYQWMRNSQDIAGATEQHYTPVANDLNSVISVKVGRAGYSGVLIGGPTSAVVSPPPVALNDLAPYLNLLSPNTATTPHTIVLAASLVIDTGDTNPNGTWATVNSIVESAGKHLKLDLSACTAKDGASANTIIGAFSPSNNNFNIIKDNVYIKGIILPSTLTSIGSYAFRSCAILTSISIPNSVTSIGDSAFSSCTGLGSISIPSNVTSIGSGAFSGCSGLGSISIPNGVTSIEDSTFDGCVSLRSISIPSSVASIGDNAFHSCSSLTSVNMNSVTSIGDNAFNGCISLASVGMNSVTSIGSAAFWGCIKLTGVSMNSVTSIGTYAFNGCTKLTVVSMNSVTSIGDYAFLDCNLGSVTIPNSVTSIGQWAFGNNSNLASVTMPGGGINLGSSIFNGCSNLSAVTLKYRGSGTTTTVTSLYLEGNGNVNVTIESGFTEIAAQAFSISGIKSVTIPGSVTEIGYQAFAYCDNLATVTFSTGSNITSWYTDSFPSGDDLWDKYSTGTKPGRYTRSVGGSVWTWHSL